MPCTGRRSRSRIRPAQPSRQGSCRDCSSRSRRSPAGRRDARCRQITPPPCDAVNSVSHGCGEEIETPAAVVDLDRLERNLARWQDHCDRVGLANRPHIKTHRSVEIARRQLELGASGITCQKLGEAEVMADGGCTDILVSFNILGESKLARLRALLDRVDLTVCADDAVLLPGLSSAAAGAARPLRRARRLRHGARPDGCPDARGRRRARGGDRRRRRPRLRRALHLSRAAGRSRFLRRGNAADPRSRDRRRGRLRRAGRRRCGRAASCGRS